MLGNHFYMGYLFFHFSLLIYLEKPIKYLFCPKTDYAPLTILKFICETFKNYF